MPTKRLENPLGLFRREHIPPTPVPCDPHVFLWAIPMPLTQRRLEEGGLGAHLATSFHAAAGVLESWLCRYASLGCACGKPVLSSLVFHQRLAFRMKRKCAWLATRAHHLEWTCFITLYLLGVGGGLYSCRTSRETVQTLASYARDFPTRLSITTSTLACTQHCADTWPLEVPFVGILHVFVHCLC